MDKLLPIPAGNRHHAQSAVHELVLVEPDLVEFVLLGLVLLEPDLLEFVLLGLVLLEPILHEPILIESVFPQYALDGQYIHCR